MSTALITPFRDGVVDLAAVQALAHRQLEAGVHALVPCGTTGEAPTLTSEDWNQVVRAVIDVAAGAVPVVVGFPHVRSHLPRCRVRSRSDDLFVAAVAVAVAHARGLWVAVDLVPCQPTHRRSNTA